MHMAEELKTLQNLSETELEKRYDEIAKNTVVSLNFYLAEIVRRQQQKQTKWIIALTAIMCIATVVSVIGIFVK